MTFLHDPDALLNYSVDWSAWLTSNETILTSEWTVPSGLTLTAEATVGSVMTAWLSGGTAGRTYRVSNRISTSDSRVDERSFFLRVVER